MSVRRKQLSARLLFTHVANRDRIFIQIFFFSFRVLLLLLLPAKESDNKNNNNNSSSLKKKGEKNKRLGMRSLHGSSAAGRRWHDAETKSLNFLVFEIFYLWKNPEIKTRERARAKAYRFLLIIIMLSAHYLTSNPPFSWAIRVYVWCVHQREYYVISSFRKS